MKKYFIAASVFGFFMTLFVVGLFSLQNGFSVKLVYWGFAVGVFSGILFSIMLYAFVQNMKNNIKLIDIELLENEKIILEDTANHIKRMNSAGGKLFLTNKRIIFKSHGANIKTYNLQFQLSDIDDIRIYKILVFIHYGIKILHDDKVVNFMVENPEVWIREAGKW
ncbi:MAG: hypothetical protein K9N09_02295 [Candidatus Cloacimonetes bacterium]|nr:hypothetical protein [Candidatus Cloacimonadota bacterium]MCF7813370.1 hypothetical protein [Candidatus Cloacimonadota bacterium]MCF7867505.1 hypothetical protein [Candidatus Cloacimonadota bacterium]MCF7882993.1 hypothetical protein [Candidatus Cloacimonadota bacterium]